MSAVMHWLSAFVPAAVHINKKERLRSCLGALVGIAMTAALTRLVVGENSSLPLLLAPMGASAVLLFAVPASPLAQPWSLVGGNLVSALVGVTCAQFIHDPIDAAVVAIPLAIGAMFSLRCIHPPSGAVALTAVLGGPSVHGLGYAFVLAPVGLNSLCLLASALLYHTLTRHRYPHRALPESRPAASDSPHAAFTRKDLNDALAQRGELLDVEVDDLQALFSEVEMRAYRRHMKHLLCRDVMTPQPKSVAPDATVGQAWSLMQMHRIKALPVVDAQRHVVGIVTQLDFVLLFKSHPVADTGADETSGLRVGDFMSRQVKTATQAQPIADLVPLFANYGHHHLPVVDDDKRLIGMVTQSNLVSGLYQCSLEQMMVAA